MGSSVALRCRVRVPASSPTREQVGDTFFYFLEGIGLDRELTLREKTVGVDHALQLEIPDGKGAHQRRISRAELRELLLHLPDEFTPESIPGLTYQRY